MMAHYLVCHFGIYSVVRLVNWMAMPLVEALEACLVNLMISNLVRCLETMMAHYLVCHFGIYSVVRLVNWIAMPLVEALEACLVNLMISNLVRCLETMMATTAHDICIE